jgi:hypothetical protein
MWSNLEENAALQACGSRASGGTIGLAGLGTASSMYMSRIVLHPYVLHLPLARPPAGLMVTRTMCVPQPSTLPVKGSGQQVGLSCRRL